MAATAAAVALGGTAAAAAAPAHPADRGSAVTKGTAENAENAVTSKMTRARVTELVTRTPDHAGNVKVRLANGKTIPIPAADKDLVMRRAAQQAKAHLKGTVDIECGISYIELKEKPNRHPVAIRTGFMLHNMTAVGFTWLATIKGPDYSDEYIDRGSPVLGDSWEGSYRSDKDQAEGIYTAMVDADRSNVVLSNGEVCHGMGTATDTRHLIKPKAACLKTAAANSGDGWILNNTEPVPHRNRTDPTSPADTRAAGAQACLRRSLGSGSDPTTDPTGWEDAKDFVAKHAPGTAISRCHLIANILGGKGQVKDGGRANLVPCWQVGMNTGTPSMRTYEKKVQDAVAEPSMGPNDAVFYQVSPTYKGGDSTIPTGVIMSAAVQRADTSEQLLFVTAILNTQAKNGLNLGN
ncbi:DNA/RNA non-specific endonuclease [Streptomyces rectiverticillatus]|uniref:DNA/RNA non-specific endonuclease n=1 Tax=Streptomyces rectiverticillatus TaxID=173860 RepID=UPI0015C2C52A|nr:DNA/RNA non-specific endonuclease [Streptomyces rectiverticillatus]